MQVPWKAERLRLLVLLMTWSTTPLLMHHCKRSWKQVRLIIMLCYIRLFVVSIMQGWQSSMESTLHILYTSDLFNAVWTFLFLCFQVYSDNITIVCWCTDDVGHAAAFLSSPLASAVTGTLLYVDNGLHAMGLAVDSPCVAKAATPATL